MSRGSNNSRGGDGGGGGSQRRQWRNRSNSGGGDDDNLNIPEKNIGNTPNKNVRDRRGSSRWGVNKTSPRADEQNNVDSKDDNNDSANIVSDQSNQLDQDCTNRSPPANQDFEHNNSMNNQTDGDCDDLGRSKGNLSDGNDGDGGDERELNEPPTRRSSNFNNNNQNITEDVNTTPLYDEQPQLNATNNNNQVSASEISRREDDGCDSSSQFNENDNDNDIQESHQESNINNDTDDA